MRVVHKLSETFDEVSTVRPLCVELRNNVVGLIDCSSSRYILGRKIQRPQIEDSEPLRKWIGSREFASDNIVATSGRYVRIRVIATNDRDLAAPYTFARAASTRVLRVVCYAEPVEGWQTKDVDCIERQ